MSDQNPQHDDPIFETMRQVMASYCKNKLQQQELRNYAGQNLMYNHAANTANLLGLTPDQKLGIQPYPASTNTNINIGEPKDEEINDLRKQIEELKKSQEAPAPEPMVIEPEPQPVQPAPQPKKRNWIPIATGVGGATLAGLGTALAMTWAGAKNDPPPPPPKQDPPAQVLPEADPLDPNVGLQVEGGD